MLIRFDGTLKDNDQLRLIADYLGSGKLLIYPTETIYGIGCDAFNETAVGRIYEIKQRPENKPLILLVRDVNMLMELVAEIPLVAQQLMTAFWPGPLTMIFRAKPGISGLLTGGTGRIGVRQSPHPLVTSIFQGYGHPLVSTSANISNSAPAAVIKDIPTFITEKVDLIIDAGNIGSTPSTVIDVMDSGIVYRREGAIKKTSIERLLYDRNKAI